MAPARPRRAARSSSLMPSLDVVQVDHGDALEPGGIGAAELGEPVVVGAEDGGHQRGVGHPEVEEALRGVEHLAGHAVEPHVAQVLRGIVPAAVHVLEAPLGRDGLGRLEPRAGVRDEADAREDLIGLDHDLVGAVDPLTIRGRPVAERGVDAASSTGRAARRRASRTRESAREASTVLSHQAGSTSRVRICRLCVSSSRRNATARIQLGHDAVQPELLAQPRQPIDHAGRRCRTRPSCASTSS